jgi:hypothetical protein
MLKLTHSSSNPVLESIHITVGSSGPNSFRFAESPSVRLGIVTVPRQLFGSSRDQLWHQLMKELSVETVGRLEPGLFGRGAGDRVQVTHGDWTITIDLRTESSDILLRLLAPRSSVGADLPVYTRIRAPYVSDGFRFTIYHKEFFSEIGKWFGMQDIEIGHPAFDSAFIVKSKDTGKVRRLFSNAKIRDTLLRMPAIRLAVIDDEGVLGLGLPEDTDELRIMAPGIPTTVEPLKEIFDLFAETLDELCRMGSAYRQTPKVVL